MFAALIVASLTTNLDVLVYTRTEGFRHECIEPSVKVLRDMGSSVGWDVLHTEDPEEFHQRLDNADVVVFLNTSADVIPDDTQVALETWIRQGGGFVGIHAAADTEQAWPFYGTLLGGAWFKDHPHIQQASIQIEDAGHPVVSFVPNPWTRTDEWYNYRQSPRDSVHVIAALDESSYNGGDMGEDHPIVWSVPLDKGVAIYTGLGHTTESWTEDVLFRRHVVEAIQWAGHGGWIYLNLHPDGGWRKTDGWSNVGGLALDGRLLTAAPGHGVITNGGGARDLYSTSDFGDCEMHIEFMVPEGGNSGVYVQGRYEIQILDSAGKSVVGPGDCGGIYQRWDESRTPHGYEGFPPQVNAARPAGEWQTYDIIFRAPRFDADGRKVANARFESVMHNGVRIHEDVELTGPTRGGIATEAPVGPIRLQGDHGSIGYRNLRVRRLSPVTPDRDPTTQ